MPYARLRNELLATREQRQAVLQELSAERFGTLLQLSLNIPGPVKCPKGSESLFRWGQRELRTRISGLEELYLATDLLGSWAVYRAPLGAAAVKYRCCAIEKSQAFARLLDIDVYRADGVACDRQMLGIEQRRCLLCAAPARECIHGRRHSPYELKARYEKLLSSCPA